jgi:hypothetical protein
MSLTQMFKSKSTKLITLKVPSHPLGCKRIMNNKRNVVLYLDKELISKRRELALTFQNLNSKQK